MALRVIRLVIPSGATAFKSFNIAQKVRTENRRNWTLIAPVKRFRLYKDTLTLLVSFLAASITVGHQHATCWLVYDAFGCLDPSVSSK